MEISRKTYQWQLHQRGLSATDLLRKRLQFAAEHGWMRCYLLFCGERAVAFIVGYQFEGTFLLDEIGHDPELSKYFRRGSPAIVERRRSVQLQSRSHLRDLQDYARYKDELSNENYTCRVACSCFEEASIRGFWRAGRLRVCATLTLSVIGRSRPWLLV